MKLRTIHKALILSFVILYAISVMCILSLGYPIWIALLWNLLTFLGADFPVSFSLPDKPDPLAFLSNVFGVIGSIIVTILLTSFLYEILSKINLREHFALGRISRLKRHIIITPSNRITKYLIEEFKKNMINFIVIDPSQKTVDEHLSDGILAIKGEAHDMDVLKKAGCERATSIILLNEDVVKNVLAAVTARKINRNIRIASRVKNLEDLPKMKRVGANYTVMPEIAIGDEIGKFIIEKVKS